MRLKHLLQTLLSRPTSARPNRRRRLEIEALEDRAVPASLHLGVLGDSLSASYAGFPGRSDDLSWTQQLGQMQAHQLQIFNEAVSLATSGDVLQFQAPVIRELVAAGKVNYVTLMAGNNDLEVELNAALPLLAQGPEVFLQGFVTNFTTHVVSNLQQTISYISSAGPVDFVLGNIANVSATPAYAGADPFIKFALTTAAASANEQIAGLAAAQHIPVIDLFAAPQIPTPALIGGVLTSDFYADDGFHPSTIVQGLLANAVLEALDRAYDFPVQALRLSDQRILANANVDYPPGRSYFDVAPFVIYQGGQIQQTFVSLANWSTPADANLDVEGSFAGPVWRLGKRK